MIPHRTIFSGFRIPSVRTSPPLDLKSCLSDLKSDLSDLESCLSEFGIWKPEKIVLCGIIGHLPLWGRCPSTIYYITTYTNRGASGTADHITLLRLFFFTFFAFCFFYYFLLKRWRDLVFHLFFFLRRWRDDIPNGSLEINTENELESKTFSVKITWGP